MPLYYKTNFTAKKSYKNVKIPCKISCKSSRAGEIFSFKNFYELITCMADYICDQKIVAKNFREEQLNYNYTLCNVYNMSGRVVSDIQTRAEGESLYIRYNTDANVVTNLKNDSSYKFIGEVILKINVV